MEIKVLGPGCMNCEKLYAMTKKAVAGLGIEADVVKVTDIVEIMKHTMNTPGLLINGRLKHSGKPLPGPEMLKSIIMQEIQ